MTPQNGETRPVDKAPQRIRLRRTKGWRKPDGAVVVARPSRWGNPWAVGDPVEVRYLAWCRGSVGRYADVRYATDDGMEQRITPELAVWLYREALLDAAYGPTGDDDERDDQDELRQAIEALRGHDLACWCPLDQPCHADVLLEFANDPDEPVQGLGVEG